MRCSSTTRSSARRMAVGRSPIRSTKATRRGSNSSRAGSSSARSSTISPTPVSRPAHARRDRCAGRRRGDAARVVSAGRAPAADRRAPRSDRCASTDDIERAFAALGADIDREIALRVATAALPMLGLRLDRVRGEDFFQAGATVAASPRWAPTVARCGICSWSKRVSTMRRGRRDCSGELDAIERLRHRTRLRPLLARAHILRAALALGDGDVAAGPREPRCGPSAARPGASAATTGTFHYYARATRC